eukprot:jgi/Chlat1/1040/Chrsp110S01553
MAAVAAAGAAVVARRVALSASSPSSSSPSASPIGDAWKGASRHAQSTLRLPAHRQADAWQLSSVPGFGAVEAKPQQERQAPGTVALLTPPERDLLIFSSPEPAAATPSVQERHPSGDLMPLEQDPTLAKRWDRSNDWLWHTVRSEARRDSEQEPALASFLYSTILAHKSLERALAFHLANKLSSSTLLSTQLFALFSEALHADERIAECFRADMLAVKERDPACASYSQCLLYFKGFLALQSHRVAHRMWSQGRRALALCLQSRISDVFHMDIHPAAKIGKAVLFDHATGVVIGETAVIGDDVSILHNVTLGGTGASAGDRHPKVGNGVLIGAGVVILGNIKIGDGSRIGAGSVVIHDIPENCTAVGVPARVINSKKLPASQTPAHMMDQTTDLMWSDYVI